MSSFAEIRSLTDAQARTLSYTEADIESILFPDAGLSLHSDPTVDDLTRKLKHLTSKEVRLQLHGATLSEYVRAKRIPRGLRIQKAPTLGRNDEDFCTKWCEIMNKASLDLMVLIIDYTQKELNKVQAEITEIKTQVQQTIEIDSFKKLEEDLKDSMQQYKEETQKRKLSKLRRDTMDYRDNKVYPWRLQTAFPATRPRKQVRFRSTPSYTSASSSEYQSDSDIDFLQEEQRPKPVLRTSTRTQSRRKPGEGDVGRGRGRGARQGRLQPR